MIHSSMTLGTTTTVMLTGFFWIIPKLNCCDIFVFGNKRKLTLVKPVNITWPQNWLNLLFLCLLFSSDRSL